MAVISFNLVVGIVQEIRAKRALDRIALLARPTATVLRAGNKQTVDPSALVVGDLLVVRPGDQIVVDGCLVGKGWIDVDESLLTGESDLIRKRVGDPISSGSFCINGSAVYEAVQVGTQSTAYQLTAGARIFRRVLTPLQLQAKTVIRILLVLACYLGLALLMITTIRQTPLVETVQMAVVIAGLVPNGLLLAIAVAYGLAAVRLANTGVLIQQANAVESLSNVAVLCCDKTGTLTANQLYVPAQFAQVVRDTTVFGRITPQQKERIVQELHAQGAYVAMVGDGLNDVLSLKRANLGIAMQSGSQMTRSAADLALLGDSFAALPRAVQEGQRVVNGMQQILRLFLTHVAFFTLLILLIPGFPFSPRQSSLVTLLAVGIPTVALAAWAQPGPTRSNKLLLRLVHFVLPAILTGSLATLFIFFLVVAIAISKGLPEAEVIATARSTITVFATVCGVLLVVFVAPPTRLLAGGNTPCGDWRPTLLAAVLLGGLTLLLSVPLGRAVFEIGALPLFDTAAIVGVALLWALLLRFIWRFRLLERMLGLESEKATT